MMSRKRAFGSIVLLASAFAMASCSDNDDSVVVGGTGNGSDNGSGSGNGGLDADARLVPILDDDEFFSAWREALAGEFGRYNNSGDGEADFDVAEESAAEGSGMAAPATEADSAGDVAASDSAGDSGGGGGSSTDDFTTTNVQEQGVDEADLVKNDGEFLYILQPYSEYCDFCDYAVEEAEFIEDDDFSEPVDGASDSVFYPSAQQATLRILSLQPDVPDATPIADVTVETQGYTTGMFLYGEGDSRSVLLSESNYGGYGGWYDSVGWSGRESAMLKLNVSDPQNVSTQRLEFDGSVISSRLIDDRLILATRFYPEVDGLNPYAYSTEEDWLAALDNIDLSEALPSYTRLADGATVPMVNPSDCFVAGEVAEGNSWPDIVTLAVFDIDDMTLQSSACFLGASETLYASPNAVYLATTRYQYDFYPDFLPIDIVEEDTVDSEDTAVISSDELIPAGYNDPRIDTDIHQFDLNGSQIQYAGSGRVSGHLGWNELQKPFRMSESNGDLRVVTMSDNQDGSVSPVNLTVLRADGTGVLQTIGELPNEERPAFIGKPAEQLYASRFLGDRGYLVTFRATDPLYVVDLSDPEDPKLAGELEVEGYSEYLHPIDENYLLGIGMDAVPVSDFGTGRPDFGDGRDGGVVQGVKVSLYNVTDPSAPTEVDTLLLGQRGTYSNALYDHRAISILPPDNGRVATRVAFGIDINGLAQPARRPDAQDAWNYYEWRYNALHGIEVRTGTDAGLTLTGSLKAASADDPDGFGYSYGSGSERAVMVGDSAYYIYGGKVRAANWFGFDNPSAAR